MGAGPLLGTGLLMAVGGGAVGVVMGARDAAWARRFSRFLPIHESGVGLNSKSHREQEFHPRLQCLMNLQIYKTGIWLSNRFICIYICLCF